MNFDNLEDEELQICHFWQQFEDMRRRHKSNP